MKLLEGKLCKRLKNLFHKLQPSVHWYDIFVFVAAAIVLLGLLARRWSDPVLDEAGCGVEGVVTKFDIFLFQNSRCNSQRGGRPYAQRRRTFRLGRDLDFSR